MLASNMYIDGRSQDQAGSGTFVKANGKQDAEHERAWWKEATVYQVYPASFFDSNGSGLGDLAGITGKLPYIKNLGTDVVWLSPMYSSPQYDMGYDISDYEDIYPPYGTLQDMDALIERCHSLDLKIIIDLVINHTSFEHEWFKESSSSKDNPKRDWYIWRPAKIDKDGKRHPPNNWRGNFQGSTWTWDEKTQEYYLHLFTPQQPDLNWDNDECRAAVYDSAISFWLKRGVDGFRVDTANIKPAGGKLPDAPIVDPEDVWQPAASIYCNGPRMHEFYREIHDKILSKYDCFTVGELPHTPSTEHVRRYISASDPQLSEVFQFDIVDIDAGKIQRYDLAPAVEVTGKNWHLSELKAIINKWQTFIDGTDAWTTVFMENHDNPRSISRYASDLPEHRIASGKMLALLNAALTGTLYLYQGQEIGQVNCPHDWELEDYIDVDAVNWVREVKLHHPGDHQALEKARFGIRQVGRDNARTPMQWDSSPNAGFTSGQPWHRVHDNYRHVNVAEELANPDGVLHFYRRILALRKQHKDLFVYGRFRLLDAENPCTFTFAKEAPGQRAVVALNFMPTPQPFAPPSGIKMALSTATAGEGQADVLQPFEGRLYISL